MGSNEEFIQLRKKYIESRFSSLNDVQREAVFCTEGPLLILAGAGSGKTMVLVNRTRYLLEFGNAYASDRLPRDATPEDVRALGAALSGAPLPQELRPLLRSDAPAPWRILAITFTNKAAAQLKSRICDTVGPEGNDVFASTFHSACVRFLRRDADRLGFPKSFGIYDADDQSRVLKEICKDRNVDDKMFPARWLASRIGRIKDSMTSPEEFAATASDFRDKAVAGVYAEYQRRLKTAGAFDFDDLIYYTVRLLESEPEVKAHYNERFRYIMVDEYQDTSFAQFRLVELLTGGHGNICVVGDDDQSIYRFRGATIENILGFEKHFEGARVIRLEQNYRSTENILDAANEVIAHNRGRKGKTLWSNRGAGDKISVYCADNEGEEAAFVGRQVLRNREAGIPLRSQAVLYRMNAQSNAIENYFARAGIPYRVYGSLKFYDRQEIKDLLAYMQLVENPADNLRFTRIINRPARKLGDATVAELARIADGLGAPMLDVARRADEFETLSRARGALAGFCAVYDRLRESYENDTLHDFACTVLDATGYRAMLKALGDEGATRLENAEELVSSIKNFETENPDGDLAQFLEEIALVTSTDNYDENADAVTLMTLHSAKGLEFDCVYITGLEEGIFPGEQSRGSEEDLEEERRLAYVGITRAKKKLYLSRCSMRMLFGATRRNLPSRFLEEFSGELKDDLSPQRPAWQAAPAAPRSYSFGDDASGGARRAPAKSGISLGSAITLGGARSAAGSGAAAFRPGDVVEHKIFGRGVVVSAAPLGGDTLVEVDFERHGRKKTMANYAPMKKV
ncbi:MAG: 3'-5' exonuclease [Oscillospiraceae bacterium]|nr:3'-5' exonuclease [Oscillospiraceae bacterium]